MIGPVVHKAQRQCAHHHFKTRPTHISSTGPDATLATPCIGFSGVAQENEKEEEEVGKIKERAGGEWREQRAHRENNSRIMALTRC